MQWFYSPRLSILRQKGLHCRFFLFNFAEFVFYETIIIECLWTAAFRCGQISYYAYSILCNHTVKNTGNKVIFGPNWLKRYKKFISCWILVCIPFASLLNCYFLWLLINFTEYHPIAENAFFVFDQFLLSLCLPSLSTYLTF